MKLYIYATVILGTIIAAGCAKDLNQQPISNLTTQNFYVQPADFAQGLNAVYNSLRTYPDRILNLSETRSDNLYAVSDGGVRDWEGINSFHKTIASNPYVIEAWNTNFVGIYRANEFLLALQDRGGVITDEALRSRYEGEARFLRAFYYFDLVKIFGRVPVTEKAVSPDEARQLQRAEVSEVYGLILRDLQFAADNLPNTYAAADRGRATKFAAKGILALVYMMRSAPTYDIKGPGLGLNEYPQALTLLNEIISSGLYTFSASFPNIFSYTNENNSEVIFDVQYATGFNPVLGATFPWLLAPDTWFQSQGKPTQGGLMIRPVSNNLLNSFEATDTRKGFSIQSGYVFNGVAETRSFVKKYIDVSKTPANRVDWPINFIALRYTDILLLKAECILRGAPGTPAEVDGIVNQVRNRAGLTPISGVTLDRLFEERRKEFVGEGSRWYDLIRQGKIDQLIPTWITAEDVQGQMLSFNKNYIIYPVPQPELDAAPGLYPQNDGY
ncbi:RagB/SusD family nutrient uptake outer membrane protein [Niabella insulamsoli]|uniref:RagB/SusD family nutrient uptake outer membrane protein n=1 Tax=Niabella insulamsoli TaxID=3144874 RepID=UPI0031FD68EB